MFHDLSGKSVPFLDRGWYLPVFKGVDPIGKVLMFKVNDYLEIKDLHIPHAYLDEIVNRSNYYSTTTPTN